MVALTDRIERQSGVDAGEPSTRMFKVLMLHGYTQSGPLFRTKTRAIEKILNKQFSSEKMDPSSCFFGYTGVQLIYPTGPVRLCPHNMLSYSAKSKENEEDNELWGWWTWTRDADLGVTVGEHDMNSGTYMGLDRTLSSIARIIRAHGGIDAVMGFSQGAAAALLVTSLLEPGREQAFHDMQQKNKDALPFPEEWRDISTLCPNGLKFTVSYSGFQASSASYRAFYEPAIKTPVLHFIGNLDNVIEGVKTLALAKSSQKLCTLWRREEQHCKVLLRPMVSRSRSSKR